MHPGYGDITPSSLKSRSVSIIYALFGIPIFGVLISALGRKFHEVKDKILQRAYQKLKKKWQRKVFSLHVVCGGGMVFFVFVPATLLCAVEGWSYFDAVYFCFITLTTIGFGDFVPGKLCLIKLL